MNISIPAFYKLLNTSIITTEVLSHFTLFFNITSQIYILKNNILLISQVFRQYYIITLYYYKIGNTSQASRGHIIIFQQDISDFARVLPCIPEELPVIVLKSPNEIFLGEKRQIDCCAPISQ